MPATQHTYGVAGNTHTQNLNYDVESAQHTIPISMDPSYSNINARAIEEEQEPTPEYSIFHTTNADPELAAARRELIDVETQLEQHIQYLNNHLRDPSSDQDPSTTAQLHSDLGQLHVRKAALEQQISLYETPTSPQDAQNQQSQLLDDSYLEDQKVAAKHANRRKWRILLIILAIFVVFAAVITTVFVVTSKKGQQKQGDNGNLGFGSG
ncbi:hypothetical protein TWF694_005369 [Orbilia ellipsospora]|uniref:Uncharacterized protein n=1 Tax=Orbilia ellipsospora TaxID=2528407 RepID=A0AAV9WSY3_9PEZI